MSFSKGDKVRVEAFEGTVDHTTPRDGYVYIRVDGEEVTVTGKMVTRLDPENWPPQVGDVWATPDGTEWYVRQLRGDEGNEVVVEAFEYDTARNQQWYVSDEEHGTPRNLTAYKDLHPVLLRRRDPYLQLVTSDDIQRAAFESGNQWYRAEHWNEAIDKGWITTT